MTEYPCTGCGQCCRMVKGIMEAKELVQPGDNFYDEYISFPFNTKEDGSCEKLNDDNTCSVYDDRPDLCNSEKIYLKYFSGNETKLEYYFRSMSACNQLIKMAGLDKKYLVKL